MVDVVYDLDFFENIGMLMIKLVCVICELIIIWSNGGIIISLLVYIKVFLMFEG